MLRILLFLITTSIIFSQELLTVDEAIRLGLENNFSILIARNNVEIDENNVTLGNAGFLPNLDASGSVSKSTVDTKQEYSNGNVVDRTGAKSEASNAVIALNWTLFDGLNMFTSYSRLKRFRDIGELNAEGEIENNVADIMSLYYNLVSIAENIKSIKEQIEISRERVAIADEKYKLGSGSKIEMLQAKVDFNADSSALLQQELVFSNTKISLNRLLAREETINFTVSDTIIVENKYSYDQLKRNMTANNKALLSASLNMDVASLNLTGIRSQWFPRVNAFVNYNYSKTENQAGFFISNQNLGLQYGLNFSLNLFNGLNTRRQIENARIELKNSEIQFKQIQSEIETAFEQQYLNFKNSLAVINLEEENLSVARQNVDIALDRFRFGTYTPLELREAQRALIEAQGRLTSAQFSAKQAEIELLRLSGEILK